MTGAMDPADPRFLVTVARRLLHREGCDSHVGGQVTAWEANLARILDAEPALARMVS